AIDNNDRKEVERVYKMMSSIVSMPHRFSNSLLHYAIDKHRYNGYDWAAIKLIELGSKIEGIMVYAMRNGSRDTVTALLDAGYTIKADEYKNSRDFEAMK